MARDTFDFDSVQLAEGGFYHSAGDAQGTMMIGWGRRRNKFVQLTQAEILNFLAAGAEMVRTDNQGLRDALDAVRHEIIGSRPRWADVAALMSDVEAGNPEASKAAVELTGLLTKGTPIADALAKVNANHAKTA
jgi:hypothetical protein